MLGSTIFLSFEKFGWLLIHDWYMLDTERMTLQASYFGSNHRISGLVQVVPLPEPFFPICIGHDDWDEQIAGLPVEATGLMHLFGSIGIDLQGNADGTHVDFASNELTCAL